MLRPLYHASRYIGKGAVNYVRNKVNAPVVVLIYHRVTGLAHDPQLLAVSPALFRQQLEILKTYPILRFEDDWSEVREPSIVITFDDGYADNFHEALPILVDMEVPATFFVTAGAIGSQREFWWDELERLILAPSALPDWFRLDGGGISKPTEWATRTPNDRMKLYADMHSMITKSNDVNLCGRIIRELHHWSELGEKGRNTHRPMDRLELEALAQNTLATIGAHGMTHLPFSRLSPPRQQEEIVSSKRLLETWLGRDISVFSYPFGSKRDYTPTSVQLVREAGYTKAAANFPGQWRRSSDPLQVPRQLVRNWAGEEFAKNLRKFWVA